MLSLYLPKKLTPNFSSSWVRTILDVSLESSPSLKMSEKKIWKRYISSLAKGLSRKSKYRKIELIYNACTLVPTVFDGIKKKEFKFHFYFSFFFGLVKWNSISISIFRFLSTCDIEKRIWILFFVFRFRRTLKRGFEFRFLFFVFSSLWKTDLNFVFRVSFSRHFGKRISISFFVFALLVIIHSLSLKNRLEFFAWIWKVD